MVEETTSQEEKVWEIWIVGTILIVMLLLTLIESPLFIWLLTVAVAVVSGIVVSRKWIRKHLLNFINRFRTAWEPINPFEDLTVEMVNQGQVDKELAELISDFEELDRDMILRVHDYKLLAAMYERREEIRKRRWWNRRK